MISITQKKEKRHKRNLKLGRLVAFNESKTETLPLSGAADSIYNNEQGGGKLPGQAQLKDQFNVSEVKSSQLSYSENSYN